MLVNTAGEVRGVGVQFLDNMILRNVQETPYFPYCFRESVYMKGRFLPLTQTCIKEYHPKRTGDHQQL